MPRSKCINKILFYIRRVLLLILFFLYIYPVLFSFVPFGLRTRTIFAIGGVIILFFQNYWQLQYGHMLVKNTTVHLLFLSCSIAFFVLFTLTINGTSDSLYLTMPFSVLVVLCAAYFIASCVKFVYNRITFELISQCIIGAVALQMVIAVIFFLNPDLMIGANELLSFYELEKYTIEHTSGLRIQGFGTNFFEAGVTNSCTLILIATMIKYDKLSFRIFYYISSFILITIIGLMMSRTTLIGCVLGFMIIIYNTHLFHLKISFRLQRVTKYIFYILSALIITWAFLPQETLDKFDVVTKFGFEMFLNYMDSGTLETASSNELKEVFLFPQNIKTILFGDGLLSDPNSPEFAYYMYTDVGYSRLVYYFGIVGTFFFFIFYLYLCYMVMMKNAKKHRIFFIMMFILLLILHIKGCVNIIFFIMPFYYIDNLIGLSKLSFKLNS